MTKSADTQAIWIEHAIRAARAVIALYFLAHAFGVTLHSVNQPLLNLHFPATTTDAIMAVCAILASICLMFGRAMTAAICTLTFFVLWEALYGHDGRLSGAALSFSILRDMMLIAAALLTASAVPEVVPADADAEAAPTPAAPVATPAATPAAPPPFQLRKSRLLRSTLIALNPILPEPDHAVRPFARLRRVVKTKLDELDNPTEGEPSGNALDQRRQA